MLISNTSCSDFISAPKSGPEFKCAHFPSKERGQQPFLFYYLRRALALLFYVQHVSNARTSHCVIFAESCCTVVQTVGRKKSFSARLLRSIAKRQQYFTTMLLAYTVSAAGSTDSCIINYQSKEYRLACADDEQPEYEEELSSSVLHSSLVAFK